MGVIPEYQYLFCLKIVLKELGLLLPDEGEIKVLNYDVKTKWKKLSKEIGVVLTNERSLYWCKNNYKNVKKGKIKMYKKGIKN
ncbi:hypothetical protein [Marinitoga sp. 1155]|uniref:hypothetical protein n=1 Tax=Marinitoga sp. 1155 TaxID=1428448 RepID=UPI0006413C90|nr:hypothetical protein [Marinitoga sp. 1155]KLO24274.1 hypothetical protein X274_04265 [Marinitoga sp. 1155]